MNHFILAELLSHGADVNVKNSEGNTPLAISIKKNQLITLQFALHCKKNDSIDFDFFA